MPDFILRNIPDNVHKDWKQFAERRGFTMRDYVLVALVRQIDRDKIRAGESKLGGDEHEHSG